MGRWKRKDSAVRHNMKARLWDQSGHESSIGHGRQRISFTGHDERWQAQLMEPGSARPAPNDPQLSADVRLVDLANNAEAVDE
jgi:hypothetical protein